MAVGWAFAQTRSVQGLHDCPRVHRLRSLCDGAIPQLVGDVGTVEQRWSERHVSGSLVIVPGTAWEQAGSSKPEEGNLIVSKELSAALEGGQSRFSQAEVSNQIQTDAQSDAQSEGN